MVCKKWDNGLTRDVKQANGLGLASGFVVSPDGIGCGLQNHLAIMMLEEFRGLRRQCHVAVLPCAQHQSAAAFFVNEFRLVA